MVEHPIVEEETVKLSPEQLQMVLEAMAEFEEGKGYTLEETREYARQRTRAWLKETPSKAA